ncbi:MAG TPA: hypothetical protein VK021_09610 [Flavobacteriaceae bacterium]|nr:hypothetical protein [Flavobacteriaceae bacterium]
MSQQENKNNEIKYSQILRRFVHPMIEETDDIEAIEKKYGFGVHVWNATNIKEKHPELFQKALQQVIDKAEDKTEAEALFNEMVNFKQKEFGEYKRVFVDVEVLETVDSGYNVTAASAELR